MDPLNNIIIVFLTGIAELWLAIPLGLVLKLSAVTTAIAAALGSVTSSFLVAFAGANLRCKIFKYRYGSDENLKKGRIYRIWNKYGVVGLGILSPTFRSTSGHSHGDNIEQKGINYSYGLP